MGRKLFKTFARIMGVTLLMACVCCTKGTEPAPAPGGGSSSGGSSNTDKTVPTIEIKMENVFAEVGQTFTIEGGKLYVGDKWVATWSDNETLVGDLAVTLTIDGTKIANGDKVEKEGNLRIEVTDKAKNSSNGFLKLVFYLAPTVKENNIYEFWDSWKKSKIVNNWTTRVGNWYEFYETIGHLHALKVIEELDRSGWNDRERKMSLIQILCLSEYPVSDPQYEEILGGVWERKHQIWEDENPGCGEHSTSYHCTNLLQEVKTRDDWEIPGIAQTYRNKIWCYPWGSCYQDALKECKAHPEKKYIIGTAVENMATTEEYPKDFPAVSRLKELANNSNSLFLTAIGNMYLNYETDNAYIYILGYNEPPRKDGRYGVPSFAATGPHMMAVAGSWPNFWNEIGDKRYDKYFTYSSLIPIGFSKEDVLCSITYPTVSGTITEPTVMISEESSPATYTMVGLAHNILALDPDMSIDDVVNLINSHPKSVRATYNDQPYNDFEFRTVDIRGMIKEVNLPKAVQSLSGSAPTELPLSAKFPNVLYTGKGVECFVDGKWMPFTAEYIYDDILFNLAFKAQKFRFNPELWAKQGGKGKAEIKVQLMTADGESIPDIERVMEIAVN